MEPYQSLSIHPLQQSQGCLFFFFWFETERWKSSKSTVKATKIILIMVCQNKGSFNNNVKGFILTAVMTGWSCREVFTLKHDTLITAYSSTQDENDISFYFIRIVQQIHYFQRRLMCRWGSTLTCTGWKKQMR